MGQMTEAGRILQLAPTQAHGRFVYALDNGTVGIYDKTQRIWRLQEQKRHSVHRCVRY